MTHKRKPLYTPSLLVSTFKRGDTIELRRRWYTPQAAAGAAVLTLVIVVLAVMLFATEFFSIESGGRFPIFIVILILTAVDCYLIALLVNTTRVFVRGDLLLVKTGPLPTNGQRRFHTKHITGFVVVESALSAPDGSPFFDLMLTTDRGDRRAVMAYFNKQRDALYFKQELEFILQNLPGDNPRKEKAT